MSDFTIQMGLLNQTNPTARRVENATTASSDSTTYIISSNLHATINNHQHLTLHILRTRRYSINRLECRDNYNNNNHDNVYGAVIMAENCESSPGLFDECRMAPSGRQPKTKPDDLGSESACTGCQKLHPPSPFIIITQPES